MKIVIVGAGDVGSFLAKDLSQRSEDVVMIDNNRKALERIEETTDVMTFQGDGTFRRNLKVAGVEKADLVVGVTNHDDTNLVITSLASSMGAKRAVARVDAPEFFLTTGGIERHVLGSFAIICASRLVSAELLRLVRRIDMEFVENFSSESISVALINVNEDFRYLDKPASDIDLGKNAKLIGIFRDGELRSPMDLAHLYSGDKVLITSKLERLPLTMKRLSKSPEKRAIIIGGGDVGYQLAQSLQHTEGSLTVIDIDRGRCQFLADKLEKGTVVHGDGTHINLLQEENVGTADYTLSVTKADEVNLMSSLISQEIGVSNTYTLVHRPGYSNIYEHLGIKGSTSAHQLISKAVNKYFPNQILLTDASIPGTEYLVGEFQVSYKLKSKNIKLNELILPPNCHLIGVSRDEEFYFGDGSSEINAGDILIIVCKRKELKTLERLFVKLK